MIEAKIDDYKAQENSISTEHDPDATYKNASDIIDHFHKHSPGGNVQNTRWMIDRYKKGEIKQEDAPDMHDTVKNFEKYKSQLPKKRIEQYKSVSELKSAMHPHTEKDEEVKAVNQDKIDKGSSVIHNSKNVTAYHVHTTEASQELGKTPKGEKLGWCTSNPDPKKNMFNKYDEKSNNNFHILHMHNEKYPYRRIGGVGAVGQFQDENNKTIEGKNFYDLLHRNPELEKIPAVTNTINYRLHKSSDPNATKEHLDKLINDPDPRVRKQIAENPNATKEHFDKLVNDENEEVRKAVLNNSPYKEHKEKLSSDKSSDIRANIAYNSKDDNEKLGKFVNDPDDFVRLNVARNTTQKEHLDHLSGDKSSLIRRAVANNKAADKDHFGKLINDKDAMVKIAATENTPHKEHLDALVKDKSPFVRGAVTRNPNATREHLYLLANDKDKDVNMAAKRELAKRS